MIKYGLDRPTELEVIPQVVHIYQPDLSLDAGENAPTVGTISTTAAGAGQVEPETLPAYEPRPTGPRVHIVDMTRVNDDGDNSNDSPHITVPGVGGLKGALVKEGKVATFLNIPFGLVQERWRPAVKAQPWDGIRDATKFGPMPPQRTRNNPFMTMFMGVPDKYVFDESMSERDCLNCNVFMPASAVNSAKEELPVLVWLYGGGMRTGGNAMPLYDGSELVLASIELSKPMIVVAINYRLHCLGFISSKELLVDVQEHARTIPEDQKQWYDLSVGNWGLLDQVLGLHWIQDHIQAFSGNPKRVTVMGQSAGACSISYLQLIPECRGLFYRSILVSGTATTMVAQYPEQEGQRIFDRLCSVFQVPADLPALEKVSRLRDVPAEAISDAINKTTDVMFRPYIDGVLFKQDCRLIIGDTSLYDPALNWVLAGTCGDEEELGASTMTDFNPFKRRLCDPAGYDLFDQIYGIPATDSEACAISSRILNSGCFKFPTFEVSEAILEHATCQLSRFHMDAVIQKVDRMVPGWGAHHGVDLPFTFGGGEEGLLLTEEERAMSRKVQAVWIEVATAASPEASSLPLVNCILPRSVKSNDKEKEAVGEEGEVVVIEAGVEEEEAVVFSRDLRVTRGPVERMTSEEIEFWRRSSKFAAQQAAVGQAEQFGFVLSPPRRLK
ncbi:Cocaine esterase [Mortierella sp. 14UC]|nr:Cocaine esterase [Mortierella sp. 14UC]